MASPKGVKTFAALCAGSAGVKPISPPPFSLSTRSLPPEIEDQVPLSTLKQAAFTTPPGTASPTQRARDGAFVLYVEKQLPVDEAALKKEVPGLSRLHASIAPERRVQSMVHAPVQSGSRFCSASPKVIRGNPSAKRQRADSAVLELLWKIASLSGWLKWWDSSPAGEQKPEATEEYNMERGGKRSATPLLTGRF